MIDEVVLWIIAIAPSLAAILSGLGLVITVLKKFKEFRQEQDYEALKSRFKKILDENYELKQLIKELLEKVDGIKRTNEESEE